MAIGGRIIVFYLSPRGRETGARLQAVFPEAEVRRYRRESLAACWQEARAVLFVTAAGIAVRGVAPLLRDKASDPAVLVMDEEGHHVVSLLGGHEGGANKLARAVARHLGGSPVVTTATDTQGLQAVDEFARERGLRLDNRERLAATSAAHLRRGSLRVYSEAEIPLPEEYAATQDPREADVLITHRNGVGEGLYLRPRDLVLGIGCNSGTDAEEIEAAVGELFRREHLSPLSLGVLATHTKKATEPGLRAFAARRGLSVLALTTEELNSVKGVAVSAAAQHALGVNGVAEPAACYAANTGALLVPKVRTGNLTLAVARRRSAGSLAIVGTGPGDFAHMSPAALEAIRRAEVVVGYKTYLRQIESLLHGKEVISSAMTQEVDRAKAAAELAAAGRRVAVVSGGDPGVYAMAGLIFEVLKGLASSVEVEVIPGISALNACAARLGAPLMHDFAAISLSDRLTPWHLIAKRLEAAAAADFVIVLYNPRSKGRAGQIEEAAKILLRHRGPATPVGIVRAAMRPDEEVCVTTLGGMLAFDIDMQCTVIIGNSATFAWRGRLVTPRGYAGKYEF